MKKLLTFTIMLKYFYLVPLLFNLYLTTDLKIMDRYIVYFIKDKDKTICTLFMKKSP